MQFEEMIDPELVPMLNYLSDELNIKGVEDTPVARKMLAVIAESILKNLPPTDVMLSVKKIASQGQEIDVYVYSPPLDTIKPAVLWIHGGGGLLGTGRDDVVTVPIVERVDCVVVSPGYRLAPENPFPAGLEDCYSTLIWMVENAEVLGIDKDNIAIAGISGGGMLAAALAHMNRDRKGPKLKLQLLDAPMIDNKHDNPAGELPLPIKVWNKDLSLKAWKLYLGDLSDEEITPYAVPSTAKDFSDLPPAYVLVGGVDLFRDDVIEYAQKLMSSGVPTELKVYPGAFHACNLFFPSVSLCERMIDGYINALKRAFG